MSGGAAGQEDLRPHLRQETLDEAATVVVRGGPDSLMSLTRHVRRTARALATYATVHLPTAGALAGAEAELRPPALHPEPRV